MTSKCCLRTAIIHSSEACGHLLQKVGGSGPLGPRAAAVLCGLRSHDVSVDDVVVYDFKNWVELL